VPLFVETQYRGQEPDSIDMGSKEEMRILHIAHQYMPEQVGGVELYTRWLSQGLNRRGNQSSVFHRRNAEGAGLEMRVGQEGNVWTAWSGSQDPVRRFLAVFRDAAMTSAFEQVLEETQLDLVHIQHLMGLPVKLVHSIRRRDLPFVITLHDFWWVCANANLLTNYSQELCDGPQAYLNCARCAMARVGQAWFWPALPPLASLLGWRNHLLRQVIEAAERLIAPTEFVRRWYTAHGVPAEKLLVVPPGLEGVTAVPRAKQRACGPVRFAYVGGISWQKGLHVLLQAFREIRGAVELWIAGDESFDPVFVGRLRELATPKVHFLGRLTRQEVWETLAEVDVVIVPSLCYETYSFVVSEAFATRVPVVASQLGPLADRVRHGVDGLLVPVGDVAAWRTAMQRLVDEQDLLPRLRANVRPPPTMEQHVTELEALYRSLVDGKRQA
jgi:glycosyltransferase involved in cell wall biosynthesis